MKGATMLTTLQQLGVMPSFSRPHVSDDNPYSEALFRTAKYRPEYPAKGFASIDTARQWASDFVAWYNYEHCHSQIRYVTPVQRHTGQDLSILENRRRVYQIAKERRPERWRGQIRNWDHIDHVWLNYPKEALVQDWEAAA